MPPTTAQAAPNANANANASMMPPGGAAAAAAAAAANLSGPRRAAIALLSLDEDLASQVLAKMSMLDVRRLCEAVEDLGDVRADQISTVLEDLERGLSDPLLMARAGGGAYLRKLADRAFGSERASKALGIEAPNPEPLQLLRTARVSALAQLLADEHPQIASVVITQLPARVASKVLALMEPAIAADLTARIAALDEIPEHAVAEASESLVRALEAVGGLASSDARAEFDGLAFSAAIINELPSEQGDDLLGQIAQRDERTATKIREALFTFEALLRIQPRELANVLRAVQAEALVTALQTASTELKEHILSSLSQRASATLRDDLSSAPPKRLSEVEAAEREIIDSVDAARRRGQADDAGARERAVSSPDTSGATPLFATLVAAGAIARPFAAALPSASDRRGELAVDAEDRGRCDRRAAVDRSRRRRRRRRRATRRASARVDRAGAPRRRHRRARRRCRRDRGVAREAGRARRRARAQPRRSHHRARRGDRGCGGGRDRGMDRRRDRRRCSRRSCAAGSSAAPARRRRRRASASRAERSRR